MAVSGWSKEKRYVLWSFIFVCFFLLSLDFWNWNLASPLLFGLPYWIIYHMVLTVCLSVVFWLFATAEWREQDD